MIPIGYTPHIDKKIILPVVSKKSANYTEIKNIWLYRFLIFHKLHMYGNPHTVLTTIYPPVSKFTVILR